MIVDYVSPGEVVIGFPVRTTSELTVEFGNRTVEFHEETPVRRWYGYGRRLISVRKDDNETLMWKWDGKRWGKATVLWPGWDRAF